MLREGLIVAPNKHHPRYEEWEYQFKDSTTGEVIEGPIREDDWWRVRWENERSNVYPTDFLIPIDPEYKEHINEIMKKNMLDYPVPFLPGQRVCLNPEASNYKGLIEHVGSDVGCVIDISSKIIDKWNKLIDRNTLQAKIEFDNGMQASMLYSNLLPVDSPYKDVIVYILDDGMFYEVDNKEDEKLSYLVINGGRKILNKEIFNNKWRTDVVQKLSTQDIGDLGLDEEFTSQFEAAFAHQLERLTTS